MRDVQISEDALEDLNNGYLFYEAQESGLGEYFAACLRADIEGLRISAGTEASGALLVMAHPRRSRLNHHRLRRHVLAPLHGLPCRG
jgi:hypothetical protein